MRQSATQLICDLSSQTGQCKLGSSGDLKRGTRLRGHVHKERVRGSPPKKDLDEIVSAGL